MWLARGQAACGVIGAPEAPGDRPSGRAQMWASSVAIPNVIREHSKSCCLKKCVPVGTDTFRNLAKVTEC